MTCFPEACLAREAEISYAVLAMATDYDCWHESHENVSVEAVVAVLKVVIMHSDMLLYIVLFFFSFFFSLLYHHFAILFVPLC